MAKQTILTVAGLKQHEEELEYLKSEKRRDVAAKIKVALSFGDLSENSEYDEAKNEQGMVESRIAELEAILANAKVLDEDSLSTEIIGLGNIVTLKDLEENEELSLYIVGSKEVDVDNGKISDESPIGAACLGHKLGDIIDVEAPAGILKFEVLEITK